MRIVIITNDKNYVKFNDMNYFKKSNLLQRKSFKIKIRKNTKDIKELSERIFKVNCEKIKILGFDQRS